MAVYTSWVDRFFAAQQKWIHPIYRPWITLKTMYITTALDLMYCLK